VRRSRVGSADETAAVYGKGAETDGDDVSDDIARLVFMTGKEETTVVADKLDARSVICKLLNAFCRLGVDMKLTATAAADTPGVVATVSACARWAVDNHVVNFRIDSNGTGFVQNFEMIKRVQPITLQKRNRKRSRSRHRSGKIRGHLDATRDSEDITCGRGAGGAACSRGGPGTGSRDVGVSAASTRADKRARATRGAQGRALACGPRCAVRTVTPTERRSDHESSCDESVEDELSLQPLHQRAAASSAPEPKFDRLSANSASRFCSL